MTDTSTHPYDPDMNITTPIPRTWDDTDSCWITGERLQMEQEDRKVSDIVERVIDAIHEAKQDRKATKETVARAAIRATLWHLCEQAGFYQNGDGQAGE